MARIKISALPTASTLLPTDLMTAVSSSVSTKITVSTLRTIMDPFPYTGSAEITGSLSLIGPYSIGRTAYVELNSATADNSPFSHGVNVSASGDFSHAQGQETKATGAYSHAEGWSTTASNQHSHAEGFNTIASGPRSHAEGSSTVASGTNSHAEGTSTVASGLSAHAEGRTVSASGDYSHAEGQSTLAQSNYSHAEGYLTTASQDYSHAEGFRSQTNGVAAHAEGRSTFAQGWYSHAEGSGSQTNGEATHAEGRITYAQALYSHTEGLGSATYGGIGSHAEGYYTEVPVNGGDYSHVEGAYTKAYGLASHAEGYYTIASGAYQHVQGQFNISSSDQSAFIIGNGTDDSNRSNLVFASGSIFEISGSLNVSGAIYLNGSSITGSGGSGTSGTSGETFGTSGTSGNSGTSGTSGESGTSGSSGSSGTSGTGFNTVSNALNNGVLTSDGSSNQAVAESNFTFDGNLAILTGSLIISGANGAGVFSQGATLVDYIDGISNSGSYMVWRAPFSCSVVGLYGYREGGGTAKVNAAKSGSFGYLLHSGSDLSLSSNNSWISFGPLQNTNYNIGDALRVVMSGSANNQIAVQVDFIRKS